MDRRTLRALLAGLATVATAALVVEAVRPRPGPAVIVDWEEVRRLARAHLAGDGELTDAQRRRLAERYGRAARELEGPLLKALQSGPVEMPPFQPLSRPAWVDLNIGILRRLVDPALAQARVPNSRLVDLGRAGVDRYVGFVLAFLARRVLGQFDPQLLGHEPVEAPQPSAGLYLVEPNIAQWEEEAHLDGEELRRWLILHEMTHAWQFGAHPWLRDHVNQLLNRAVSLVGPGADPLSRLVGLTLGLPAQWQLMQRMQATMSLVEGYSNLAMDLAGRGLLKDYERLEEAHRKRSSEKGALELLFFKLTGLELKLQQYRRGEAFSRAVYEAHGMRVLNLAWESADNLPRLEELENPEGWSRRVTRSKARATGR